MSDEFDDYDLEPEDSRGVSRETGREKKKVRGGPFAAGQSGNPAGKPKVTGIEDVRAIAREWTQLAIETLVEVMSNPDEKGAARVTAAGVILDRGWGKAPQTVVVDGEVDVARLDNTSLDEITKREIASYIGKALAGAGEEENTGKLH